MSEEPLFGKFKIIKCYKKDDSLAVYLADHIYLNKKIILKTLNTSTIADQVVLERFKREARLLAKISHPNIISVYDFGTFEEFFYISFEYFDSLNLRQAFSKNSWTIEDKINILKQIATGLSETHKKKIIHRDLKPENILIDENLEVKIADFGLAQVSGGEKLTAAEAIVGTPAYMTPEQIQGLNADERSDLFSFGILIYELFFGVNPFLGKDAGQTLNNIQTCRINTPPPHSGMPEYIPFIIDSLLKKHQADRPASVDFILNFLQENVVTEGKRKIQISRILIPVVLIVVMVILFVFQDDLPIQPSSALDTTVDNTIKLFQISPIDSSILQFETKTEKKADTNTRSNVPTRSEVPVSKSTDTATMHSITENISYGYMSVKCKPWADVYIDSIKIDTTPFKEILHLSAGEHTIMLKHPEYPEYVSTINIPENDTLRFSINLDNLAGYFICNVFPWGDIYINGEHKGQTPLNKPIILKPGKHTLSIQNPGYEIYNKEIQISKSDTLKLTVKLERPDGAN